MEPAERWGVADAVGSAAGAVAAGGVTATATGVAAAGGVAVSTAGVGSSAAVFFVPAVDAAERLGDVAAVADQPDRVAGFCEAAVERESFFALPGASRAGAGAGAASTAARAAFVARPGGTCVCSAAFA